jgi:hypothetical protein
VIEDHIYIETKIVGIDKFIDRYIREVVKMKVNFIHSGFILATGNLNVVLDVKDKIVLNGDRYMVKDREFYMGNDIYVNLYLTSV